MNVNIEFDVVKDSSTLKLKEHSINVDPDNFDGVNLKVEDVEVGDKFWFVLGLSNSMRIVESVDEVINFITFPNGSDFSNITLIHNGMVLIEFEVKEEFTHKITYEIYTDVMPTGNYFFNTQYLKGCYTTHRSNRINRGTLDLEIYPYPDRELVKASYEVDYKEYNIPVKDNKAIRQDLFINKDIFVKGETIKKRPPVKHRIIQLDDNENYKFYPDLVEEGIATEISIIPDNPEDVIDLLGSYATFKGEHGFQDTIRLNGNTNSFQNVRAYSDVGIFLKFDEIIKPPIEGGNNVEIDLNLINCFSDYNPEHTIFPNQNYTITFYADEGYSFVNSCVVLEDNITSEHYPEDKKKFSITVSASKYIKIELIASKDIQTDVNAITTFVLDDKQLLELSKIRLINGGEFGELDYSPFVLYSYMFPMALNENSIGEERNIVLGDHDTYISAKPFEYNIVDHNLGSVEVPEKYNNVYDYMNVDVICRLPFSQPITLPTHHVIGYEIMVVYTVDYYTGNITINIYSSSIDGIIHTSTINPTRPIPLFISDGSVSKSLGDKLINTIDRYSIEVRRNIPYFAESEFGREVEVYNTLNEYDGFVKVEDINLNSSATSVEKEKIIALLKNGVVINNS